MKVALVLMACALPGCIISYGYRTVEIQVTDHDTGQPVSGTPVVVWHLLAEVLNPPKPVFGTTDDQGRVTVKVAIGEGWCWWLPVYIDTPSTYFVFKTDNDSSTGLYAVGTEPRQWFFIDDVGLAQGPFDRGGKKSERHHYMMPYLEKLGPVNPNNRQVDITLTPR